VVVVAGHQQPDQILAVEVQAAQASLSSNTQTRLPFPTPVVVLLTQPQLLVDLLLQHLLPEPAMFRGVNNGTLRIS
jgi:hypothetical protein